MELRLYKTKNKPAQKKNVLKLETKWKKKKKKKIQMKTMQDKGKPEDQFHPIPRD